MSSSPSSPRKLVICNINPLTCFPPVEKCYLNDHLASFLPPFRGETHPSTRALDQTLSCLVWDLIPLLVSSTSLSTLISLWFFLSLFFSSVVIISTSTSTTSRIYIPGQNSKLLLQLPAKHHHMEAGMHLKSTPGPKCDTPLALLECRTHKNLKNMLQ